MNNEKVIERLNELRECFMNWPNKECSDDFRIASVLVANLIVEIKQGEYDESRIGN